MGSGLLFTLFLKKRDLTALKSIKKSLTTIMGKSVLVEGDEEKGYKAFGIDGKGWMFVNVATEAPVTDGSSYVACD